MAIHVDVILNIHERELKAATRKLKREASQLGVDLSDRISKGFKTDSPKIIKALDGETDAVVRLRRATVDLNEVIKNKDATGEQQRRAMENLSKAIRDTDRATKEATTTNKEEIKLARQRAQIMGENAKAFATLRTQIDQQRVGIEKLRYANTGLTRDNASLIRSFDRVTDATSKTTREQSHYNRMIKDGTGNREALIRQSNSVRDAYEREQRAIRDVGVAMRDLGGDVRGLGGGKGSSERRGEVSKTQADVQGLVGSLMGLRLGGTVGSLALVGITKAGVDLIKMAVTASQSLWLLPSALTAGAAGMGTLTLATSGFSDVIGALAEGDLEKFAKEIQRLSPNAQQAALSIQAIFPQLEDLRKATSDSFFAGIGAEIERLNTTYLPMVQRMTTGIANAFNQMLTGVSIELMEPETQATMQHMFDNLSQTFQNLAPAARDLAQAFIDIASAGSDFLPDLASGAADAAREFAAFIREARESGKLREWIQDGIQAVGDLAGAMWDLSQTLYTVFGSDAQGNIENFRNDVQGVKEIVEILDGDFSSITEEIRAMTGAAGAYRDLWMDVPEIFMRAMQTVADTITSALNLVGTTINNSIIKPLNMVIRGLNTVGSKFPGGAEPLSEIPEIPGVTGPQLPTGGNWESGYQPMPPGSTPDRPDVRGARPGFYRDRWGKEHRIPQPGGPAGPGTNRDVPPPPPPGGGKPSDKDIRDEIIAGLDPSLWRVDPNAPIPGMPPPGTGLTGRQGTVDPYKVITEQNDLDSAVHDLEESKQDLLARQKDGVSTQQDIEGAKWKVHEDEIKLWEAQHNLLEAQQGTAKEFTNSFEGLGAAIDQDFGISKGLPGIADNIVRFLANMAAAPLLGQLAVQRDAAGGVPSGAGGLIGMAALNGSFGPQYVPTMQADGTWGYGDQGQGSQGAPQSLAQRAVGTPTGTPPGSSYVPPDGGLQANAARANDLIAQQFPQLTDIGGYRANGNGFRDHPSGNALDIMTDPGLGLNESSSQGLALGNQINDWLLDNKDAIGLVSTIWQQKDHFNHIHALFSGPGSPGGEGATASGIPGMPGAISGSASFNGSSIPIPLPVTIVGGGGGNDGWWGSGAPAAASSTTPGSYTPSYADIATGGPGVPAPAPKTYPALTAAGQPSTASIRGLPTHPGSSLTPPGYAEGGWVGRGLGRPSPGMGEFAVKPGDPGFIPPLADAAWNGQYAPWAKGTTPISGVFDPRIQLDTSRTHVGDRDLTYGKQFINTMLAGAQGAMTIPGLGTPIPGLGEKMAAAIAHIPRFGGGGSIGGVGNTDTVPAMLTPGELVVDKDRAPWVGRMLGYQTGGPVIDPNSPGMSPPAPQQHLSAGAQPGVPVAPGPPGVETGGSYTASGSAGGGGGLMGAAASALPGGGMGAQIAIQEMGRAIQYAGEVAGIAVGGLMETFLPTGGSELANNSWLTRIAGGIAGASPQLPNVAGKAPNQDSQQQTLLPLPAPTPPPAQGGGVGAGNTYNLTVNTDAARTNSGIVNDINYHQTQQAGVAPSTGQR